MKRKEVLGQDPEEDRYLKTSEGRRAHDETNRETRRQGKDFKQDGISDVKCC